MVVGSAYCGSPILLSCNRCKVAKPIGAFRKRPNRSERGKRRGRCSFCISCEKAYYETPRMRSFKNARTAEFRSRLRETNYEEFRRREREGNLRRLYGIGICQYEEMLAAQNGVCAICGGDPGGRWKRRFHVDHDHETGAVRGLLCHGCNAGLGLFEECAERLVKAAEYLKQN